MDTIKYPIGIQSFQNIRNDGYLYVDKTKYVYNLVSTGKYYFLSRPRRFGKSLLMSTLDALFRGRRDLFKGLAIDSLPWDWQEYPVLHFDFSGNEYREEKHLDNTLNEFLRLNEVAYGITDDSTNVYERFRSLIRRLHEKTGRQAVILIDEYDQPLLKSLRHPELREIFRMKLQTFYAVLKTMDEHIKFGMLTGITRFSKVSVFSALNNLDDLSLDSRFNAICGISETELTEYFSEGITSLAKTNNTTVNEIRQQLKDNYDGYHFSEEGEDIYNPFSLLNTFAKLKFSQYWFNTGTPDFLVYLLENSRFKIPELDGYVCTEDVLNGSDIYMKDPVPLFYQTGYLTIKGYDPEFRQYTLGFPNKEVSEGFAKFLMRSYLHGRENELPISDFVMDVRQGRAESFMKKLKSFTAGIPYDSIPKDDSKSAAWIRGAREAHYQNVIYVLMKLMGFYTRTECRTATGRIDIVVETADYVYIMELKTNSTPEKALMQIEKNGYAEAYEYTGKRIFKIGANFSTRTQKLTKWIIAE